MRIHKTMGCVALAATALLVAAGASAQTVAVSQTPGYHADDGEFTITPIIGAGYSASAIVSNGFQSFCISRNAGITIPGTYFYEISSSGIYQPDNLGISIGTAWLYSQFATGVLPNYHYNGANIIDPGQTLSERANDAYNLQLAFWTMEGQYWYGPGAGAASAAQDIAENPWLALVAQTFGGGTNGLIEAMSANTPGTYNVGVLNLNVDNAGTEGGSAQPVLVLLPQQPACIGDFIWNDLNHNGIQDAGEPGIGGATVLLTDCSGNSVTDINGNPVSPYVTGTNGFYTFTNLPPGSYEIRVLLPSGYVFTQQFAGTNTAIDSNVNPVTGVSDCRTLVAGQCDDTVDAGAYIPQTCTASLCGSVFADCDGNGVLSAGDIGLPGVPVKLLGTNGTTVASTTTDTNGAYCFNGLSGGSYLISITPPAGYAEIAASTGYHWKDSYGRNCWLENDGYAHCLNNGTECWLDNNSCLHWKDAYGNDCWKDGSGSHCKPCCYTSCNTTNLNNTLCVTLTNCQTALNVNFALTGIQPKLSVCVTAPSTGKCGQTITYTCCVTNTGNVCFKGGTICHNIGNSGGFGWNGGTCYTTSCPPLAPGQSCVVTQQCPLSSWNYGTLGCQATVTCNQTYGGTCSGQSYCTTQVTH